MATVREENPYEGGGGFGKFRKRPFRRAQATPYDRPSTALRNPNRSDNWLSKVVDPAQRLIVSSAHRFFSSVFRKRLPPPPPPSAETVQEVRENHQEAPVYVADDSSDNPLGAVGISDVQINYSDGVGLTELEKLLKQKTFTRSEIDRLTALMHSRTVNSISSIKEEEKRPEVGPSDAMLPYERKEEYSRTAALENGIENRLVPYATSSAHIDDAASPAELAKAYMVSRPSKVSQSVLGLRSAPREDPTLLKSQHFTQKSITSIVPSATNIGMVYKNGFVNPRSRGRSAIYSMARTPYARVYPASMLKGVGVASEGQPSSSAQCALDHNMLSRSEQGALKCRSSVLDNDIGSVGPVRRIRQRSNLPSSKGLISPHSSSPMSITRSSVGIDLKNPILLGEVKRSPMTWSAENVDDTMPSTSFPRLPSKSSEMASKILQQLDKLSSPKEKASAFKMSTMNDKSPIKWSSSTLQGQALRSMEAVDSSKFLNNRQDKEFDGSRGNLLASGQKLTSQIDKVENGSLKLVGPDHVVTDSATVPRRQVISIGKLGDSSVTKPVSYPLQKKRAFHMSAHEDDMELEDDAYPTGDVSPLFTSGKQTIGSTSVAEKTTCVIDNTVQEMPLASSIVMPSRSNIDGEPLGTADGYTVDEKVNVSKSKTTSSIPGPLFKAAVPAVLEATHPNLGSNKLSSSSGSVANLNQFNATELTAADAPSEESTKSGPIFGLKKVDSSTESGANVPLVNKNVGNASQVPFNFSSSVGGGSSLLKFGAASDSKLRSSISSTTIAGVADAKPEVLESVKADDKTNMVTGFSTCSSEPAVSSATSSLLMSPTNISSFGNRSNQNNGPVSSMPLFSSPFTSSSIFSNSSLAASTSNIDATIAPTCSSLTTSPPAVISSSNSSLTALMTSLSPTTSFSKFVSAPTCTSGSEPVDHKGRHDEGIFDSSSAVIGSTGSGILGLRSSAPSTVNNQSQGSVFSTSGGSVLGSLAPPTTSCFPTSIQSHSVGFGSSASLASFGSTVNPAFSPGSSLFHPSTATNPLSSGTTFGQSPLASSLEANPVSSVNGTSSTFGLSSWHPSKAPFGSVFSSSASSTSGFFSLGTSTLSVASTSSPMMFGSSTSASSGPRFSFSSAAATTNMQPTFGSPSPVFAFGSASNVNNDQMGMEDSMAEDTVQATQPATAVFSQPPAERQSNFVFGASTSTPTPTGVSPFQFASQQNFALQNSSPFQASAGLEFSAGGGSSSLGAGGVDKAGRKYVKVSRRKSRKAI